MELRPFLKSITFQIYSEYSETRAIYFLGFLCNTVAGMSNFMLK